VRGKTAAPSRTGRGGAGAVFAGFNMAGRGAAKWFWTKWQALNKVKFMEKIVPHRSP